MTVHLPVHECALTCTFKEVGCSCLVRSEDKLQESGIDVCHGILLLFFQQGMEKLLLVFVAAVRRTRGVTYTLQYPCHTGHVCTNVQAGSEYMRNVSFMLWYNASSFLYVIDTFIP